VSHTCSASQRVTARLQHDWHCQKQCRWPKLFWTSPSHSSSRRLRQQRAESFEGIRMRQASSSQPDIKTASIKQHAKYSGKPWYRVSGSAQVLQQQRRRLAMYHNRSARRTPVLPLHRHVSVCILHGSRVEARVQQYALTGSGVQSALTRGQTVASAFQAHTTGCFN
jgi:hypothetical protein